MELLHPTILLRVGWGFVVVVVVVLPPPGTRLDRECTDGSIMANERG